VSRRWRGGRPTLVVIDEAAAFRPPDAVDGGAAALLEKSNARNRELCAENEQLRKRARRLQNLYDAEILRGDEARRDLADAVARVARRDEALTVLQDKLAAVDAGHAGTCAHAAQVRALKVLIAAQQDRLTQLQRANEAHDRAPRGWGK
jgi:hypothetical protein